MNQHDTLLSQLSMSDKVQKSVGLSDTYSCMSSAYWWYWTLCWEMTSPIGDTYIPKRIGPKTEPWGTPDAHGNTADFSDPTVICWVCSVTKDRSQSKATPWMPNTVRARSASVVWLMASNADDILSANRAVHWPLPAALWMLLTTLRRAVSLGRVTFPISWLKLAVVCWLSRTLSFRMFSVVTAAVL